MPRCYVGDSRLEAAVQEMQKQGVQVDVRQPASGLWEGSLAIEITMAILFWFLTLVQISENGILRLARPYTPTCKKPLKRSEVPSATLQVLSLHDRPRDRPDW